MKYLKDFFDFESINEERGSKLAVRTVVRDIVYVLKTGFLGHCVLPFDSKSEMKFQVEEPPKGLTEEEIEDFYSNVDDDIDDEFNVKKTVKYKFDDFPVKFSVTLKVLPNFKIKEPRIDGDVGSITTFDSGEKIIFHDIGIKVTLNPRREIGPFLYRVISELNITVAHEMEHLLQDYYDEQFDESGNAKGIDYYTLPVEVPAQVAGFKRIYDLKKRDFPSLSFEDVVRDWFQRRRYRTKLNITEEQFVINNIVGEYQRKYGR